MAVNVVVVHQTNMNPGCSSAFVLFKTLGGRKKVEIKCKLKKKMVIKFDRRLMWVQSDSYQVIMYFTSETVQ